MSNHDINHVKKFIDGLILNSMHVKSL